MITKYAIDFEWRGFELHPEIPEGGLDIDRIFPKGKVDAMNARLAEVARGLGVHFDPRPHAPSTKPALAISEFARRQGKLDAWRELAMDAHWAHGLDLEDRTVLATLAQRAGLDSGAAVAFLDDPAVPELLHQRRVEAQRWGVTGIPTWSLLPSGWNPGDPVPSQGPRPVRVVGCQPWEHVEQAAHLAGARSRED